MTISTSHNFDVFFEALKQYTVELYGRDYDTDEMLGDADDLSDTATQQLFEVARQFWALSKNHIAIFLNDVTARDTANGVTIRSVTEHRHDAEDTEVLKQMAVWFASAFNGAGLSFTDTTLEVIQTGRDTEREYDGIATQEMLDQLAQFFYGEVSIYAENQDDETVLHFDCAPALTLRWGNATNLRTYPPTVKL